MKPADITITDIDTAFGPLRIIGHPGMPHRKMWALDPTAVIYGGVRMSDWLRLCDLILSLGPWRWYDSGPSSGSHP